MVRPRDQEMIIPEKVATLGHKREHWGTLQAGGIPGGGPFYDFEGRSGQNQARRFRTGWFE